MTKKEPKNETFLAAELAQVTRPVFAARAAAELCAIGRAYKAVAERLCGGEEQWGPWSGSVAKAQERAYAAQAKRITKARGLVAGLPVQIEVSAGSGLILTCRTQAKKGHPALETAML